MYNTRIVEECLRSLRRASRAASKTPKDSSSKVICTTLRTIANDLRVREDWDGPTTPDVVSRISKFNVASQAIIAWETKQRKIVIKNWVLSTITMVASWFVLLVSLSIAWGGAFVIFTMVSATLAMPSAFFMGMIITSAAIYYILLHTTMPPFRWPFLEQDDREYLRYKWMIDVQPHVAACIPTDETLPFANVKISCPVKAVVSFEDDAASSQENNTLL